MPEGLEAEIWRTALTDLVGRSITRIERDERVVDPGVSLAIGEQIVDVRRHGKVVLVETSGPTLGLRFGMTGRLVIDGRSPIESLEYASSADRSEWDRLLVWAGDHTPAIRLNDPRRLGSVEIDPDLSVLGPDVFDLTPTQLATALEGRRSALKVALMNQRIVAGLGNLCVDEVLFHARVDPTVVAGTLGRERVVALARTIRRRLPIMLAAGGSTTGVLDPDRRHRLGACPRRGCAGALVARTLGGRTTVWCPSHQIDPGD